MSPLLLPAPRQLSLRTGTYPLGDQRLIQIVAPEPQRLFFSARRVQAGLEKHCGLHWSIVSSFAVPASAVGLTLRLAPQESIHAQGYRLQIEARGITILAADEAGLFYGVDTLVQLLAQAQGPALDLLEVVDWPDFAARGVMLDVSRNKVPTLATLFELVDRLASWKINQFQLYIEHTFAYQNHPEVWQEYSPLTGEDILALDAYCRERYIELVPNQNSFGHLRHWLIHPRYAHLAEIQGEFKVPWGTAHGPFGLAAVNPGSIELVRSMYDELLPHFSSRMVNVGCDETFDLGSGQSQAACAERGIGRVYLDFLLQIYAETRRRGFQIQFWGDIIEEHPELVPELPRDAIALLWGYEARHPFDQRGALFAAAGVPFYVCPGTSSWNSLAGRTENALANLLNAAENGLKHGACGYLNTDWGDNGHWQAYPVAFLGYAAGAAYSWCLEQNRDLDIAAVTSRFAFEDPSGQMGRLAYDLGDVYRASGILPHNSSVLFHGLNLSLEALAKSPRSWQGKQINLGAMREELEAALEHPFGEQIQRADAELIRREYRLTGRLMRHALRRIELALAADTAQATQIKNELSADLAEWLPEYRTLWLARNRPGGLQDSTRRFDEMAREYQA